MLIKEVITICKTILRNGFDAHIINARLQEQLYNLTKLPEMDVACEGDFESLVRIFPDLEKLDEEQVIGVMQTESGIVVRLYPIYVNECSHPEFGVLRITPHILQRLQKENAQVYEAIQGTAFMNDPEEAFEERTLGYISLRGVPYVTIQRNYRLAITALRLSVNYDLEIDPTTWLAIVRSANNIADYLPMSVFVEEMHLVAAENLWKFVQLLADSFILHSVLPEVAALKAIKQQKNKEDSTEVSVFDYTVDCMRHYPEENLHHDWLGTVALLFHAVGKIHTAENYHGRWTFYQYHRVGAQITRAILQKLHFPAESIDLICELIRNHIRFQSMLTYKGIRDFQALPETERLIEITRAIIKATNTSYINFNHNMKYLESADKPEEMLKPFLSGNEIMEVTDLPQGKTVGLIRAALLQAQIDGKVKNHDDAVQFVLKHKQEK